MTPLLDFAQYGPITFLGAVIAFIVYLFLRNQKGRDKQFIDFIAKQEESFKAVITNHIQHDIDSRDKFKDSHIKLTITIEELLKWLRRNNK